MSKETERFFREFQEYIDQFEDLSESEVQEKLDAFMAQYNGNLRAGAPREKDQWYYLDLAYEAEDEKMARKHAQKALSIDPYCTDAETFLINLMDITPEEMKKRYAKLIEKTESHLREEGYFEDDMGSFYGVLETRPYMRIMKEYLDILILLGKYPVAVDQAKKMLELSENDNVGARHELMALYAMMGDVEGAEELHKAYPEESTSMLLPLILLYYSRDDYTKARRYLKIVDRKNPDFRKMMMGQLTEQYMEKYIMPDGFMPNTIGEIMDFMDRAEYLVDASAGAFSWMRSELKKKKK